MSQLVEERPTLTALTLLLTDTDPDELHPFWD